MIADPASYGPRLARRYSAVSVLSALVVFAVFLAAAAAKNAWRFEYPLDDVYIHLAMAEQMAAGGYGVNAGEYASAASSPLYPFLLVPFAGTELHRWLPLIWNCAALVAAAWLMGRLVLEAGLGRAGLILAVAMPFALFMFNSAYTGMENMAHGAASLAIVLGLLRFTQTGKVGWLLLAGVFLAPAFRLEGLALAVAAGGVVFTLGRWGWGVALSVLAAIPVAAMMVSLASLGLDKMPNSVTAKLPATSSAAEGFLAGAIENIAINAATGGGRLVLILMLAVWLLAMVALRSDERARGLIGLAVAVSALAHLAFAATGWLDRYENYLVLSLVGTLCILIVPLSVAMRWSVLVVAILGGVLTYAPNISGNLSGMRAIHLQHGEMSRFAKDYLKSPVAVNDLGYVAWNNPDYVLDLAGLASAEALELRLKDAPPGWADALTDERGVRVAMIYDHWVGEALGPDWVRLGQLVLFNHGGAFLGGDVVSFYARNMVEARALQADLKEWMAGLPEGAGFAIDVLEGGT